MTPLQQYRLQRNDDTFLFWKTQWLGYACPVGPLVSLVDHQLG